MIRKRKLKLDKLFIGMLIVGVVVGILYRLTSNEVKAAWYDDSWGYRVKIVVSNSGAAVANQKVKFDIATDTLVTAGKIQSDCGDSRFTDAQGNILEYFLDTSNGACNTNSTDYYVLLSTINSGDTIVYHYYGNPSASNGTRSAQFSESTFSPAGTSSASEESTTTPVSYWKFDEGDSISAYDSTGQANTLTVTNAVWKDESFCISGKCLYFDGSGDYARKTYSSDTEFNPGTSSFTISAWSRHSTSVSGDDIIVSRVDGKNGVGWKLYMNTSGFLCFGIDQTSGSFPVDSACTTTSYADARWHNVVGVKTTTSKITLFVDGVQVAEDVSITASSITGSNGNFTVGNDFDVVSEAWVGFIDDVKYYNFARSADQIKADFNSRGVSETNSTRLGGLDSGRSLNTDLVGYWRMDESSWTGNCSTGTVNDSSGNSKTGIACPNGSAPTPAAGKFGNSVSLNGTTQYFDVGTGFNFTSSFSVSAWVNLNDRDRCGESIASTMGGNGDRGWDLINDCGGFVLELPLTSTSTSYTYAEPREGIITNSTWYHVVGVYDAKSPNAYIYIDGVLRGAESFGSVITASLFNPNNNLQIGRSANNFKFLNGKIDEVRIYNRALGQSEVSALYNFAPGPIGYWKFDEKTGSSPADSSTLGQTGSFTGTPTWVSGKVGNALNFSGSNAVTATITDPAFSNTVEAWVFPTTTAASKTIITSGKLATDSSSRPTYGSCTGTALSLNTWAHIVATSTDSTHCAIYQNGVLTSTSSSTGVTFGTSVSIGASSFIGIIDEVKIYSYPRSAKQVVADLNNGNPNVGSPVGSAVGYWKMDEGIDNTCKGGTNDACNSGSAGTTLDAPQTNMAVPATAASGWTTSGKFNKALNFDGSDDVLTVTNSDAIDLDTGLNSGLTISGWVNPDTVGESSNGEIFRKSATTYCRLSGSTPFTLTCSLDLSTDATIARSAVVPASTWTHVSVSWNNDTDDEITMWINGVKRGESIDGVGPNTSDSSNLSIGGGSSTNWDGKIDEFKVYSYELSESEIKVEYNRGAAMVLGTEDVGQKLSDGAGNAPVAWWKLDERSTFGTSAVVDSSGNNLNLTTKGSINNSNWKKGKIGNALNFNGSSDYVCSDTNGDGTCDISSSTLRITGNLSLSLWVYARSRALDHTFISQSEFTELQADNTLYRLAFNDSNGDIKYAHEHSSGTNEDIVYDTNLGTNTWYHLEVVRDTTANTVALYVDGRLIANTSYTTDPDGGTNGLLNLGTVPNSGTNFFDGIIDDVKIYNYARTAGQVAFDYNEGAPVGWWKFDECQGTVAFDSALNSNGGFNGQNGTLDFGDATGNNDSAGTCNSGASGTTNQMWNAGTNGKFNSSLSFDGVNDSVEVTGNTRLMLTGDMSYSVWLKANTIGNQDTVLAYRNGADDTLENNVLYSLTWNTGAGNDFRLQHENGAGVNNNTDFDVNLTTGVWYFVTVTRTVSTNTYRIYLDGRLAGTKTYTNDPDGGTSSNLYIGSEEGKGNAFDGQIDDVRIFNYVLSANQVTDIYNNGSTVRFGPATGTP